MSAMPDNPALKQARKQIAEARQQFQDRISLILLKASDDADGLAKAIGEISLDQAYAVWVQNILESIKVHDRSYR